MAPPRVSVGISICLSLDLCSRSCGYLILCIILCVCCFFNLVMLFRLGLFVV